MQARAGPLDLTMADRQPTSLCAQMSDSEDADDLSGSEASGPTYGKRAVADDEAEEAAPGEEEPSGDSEPEGEDLDKASVSAMTVRFKSEWYSSTDGIVLVPPRLESLVLGNLDGSKGYVGSGCFN